MLPNTEKIVEPTEIRLALPPISVIIPAYNEQAFIETTLDSILESKFPCEVIVIDDGSSDQTPKILEKFESRVKILTHPTNKGKGAAIASGLREANGKIVIFCDAHLLGLRLHHLLSLVFPLVYGSAKVTLGVDVPEGTFLPFLGAGPFLILTGQRAYFKQDLVPLLGEIEDLGYGVETFLFTRFPRERTSIVLLPGLIHLVKPEKSSLTDAAAGYLRETREILDTLIRLQSWVPTGVTQIKQKVSALLLQYANGRN